MVFKQSFQWFFDMSTDPDGMQVITVKAGGEQVKRRLLPFFAAFKYYKLGSVNVKFVPASTLPVDPTGLSLEAGESTVDPRDQFNPGLVRITNGEDFNIPESALSTRDFAEAMFYSMMLDPRWFKFQLQSGMSRTARPLYWGVGQLHQDVYPGTVLNMPNVVSESSNAYALATNPNTGELITGPFEADASGSGSSSPFGLFQTGLKEPLDWMPTDWFQRKYYGQVGSGTASVTSVLDCGMAPVPEVELMKIILPMAYKTKYYYRVYVTETVMFREPVSMNAYEIGAGGYLPSNNMDRFIGITDYTKASTNPATLVGVEIETGNTNDGHNVPR